MIELYRFSGLGVVAFVFAMACQESDLPIGEIPEDGGESSGGAGGGIAGAGGKAPVAGTSSVAGTAGSAPYGNVRYAGLTAASIRLLKSADTVQSTPPVLAPIEDGVIVAGASADAETTGIDEFEPGIESEAFVGRLTVEGFTWNQPLLSSGMPRAIAKTPDGDFVIDGAYLPDEARVSPKDVSTSRVLNRVDGGGSIVYDSRIPFDVEVVGASLAVDSQGSVFLGGGAELADSTLLFTQRALLVKCAETGEKLWDKAFDDPFGLMRAAINAVAVLENDDVLAAGSFDPSTMPEQVEGTSSIARFTTSGDLIWSIELTGSARGPAMVGALLPLEGGDFLVAGSSAGDFALGGTPFDVPDPIPDSPLAFTVFVARLDRSGSLRWLSLDPDSFWPTSIATDDRGNVFVALEPAFGAQTERVFLRSFDVATGALRQSFAATGSGSTWASSLAWSANRLWIAGAFSGEARFGADAAYDDPAGVFVAHIEPED